MCASVEFSFFHDQTRHHFCRRALLEYNQNGSPHSFQMQWRIGERATQRKRNRLAGDRAGDWSAQTTFIRNCMISTCGWVGCCEVGMWRPHLPYPIGHLCDNPNTQNSCAAVREVLLKYIQDNNNTINWVLKLFRGFKTTLLSPTQLSVCFVWCSLVCQIP